MKRGKPSTLSGRSTRARSFDACGASSTSRRGSPTFTWRSTTPARSAYEPIRAPSGPEKTPDTNRTCSISSPALRAAVRRNNSRASAQTRRTAAPETVIDRLPAVRPSSGDEMVLVAAARTVSGGTSSSWAASWVSAVRIPWPSSTLPTRSAIAPSSATVSHVEIHGLVTSEAGRLGVTFPNPPLRVRLQRSANGCRSGTDGVPAPPTPRRGSAADCQPGARLRS